MAVEKYESIHDGASVDTGVRVALDIAGLSGVILSDGEGNITARSEVLTDADLNNIAQRVLNMGFINVEETGY